MKRLNDLYEQITPETSPEELAQKIMNTGMKPTLKKRPSKVMTAVLAAAVSLSVLTVSVGAANNWDYAGIFKSIFGEKSENITENIVPEATVLEDTIDTMNFELAAVAADKRGVLAIVDVYSENGYKLIEEIDGGTDVKPLHDLYFLFSSESIGGSGVSVNVLEASEERLRLSIRMSTNTEIKNGKVTLSAILQETQDGNGNYLLDIHGEHVWSAKFTVDYSGGELAFESNAELLCADSNDNTVYAALKSIELSSISAYFELGGYDLWLCAMQNLDECYAVLESGERVTIGNATSASEESGSMIVALGFNKPINPNEVCAIVLGEQTIEIK